MGRQARPGQRPHDETAQIYLPILWAGELLAWKPVPMVREVRRAMPMNDEQPISREDLRRELIRRKQENRQLIKHFEEATRAVKSALAGSIKLKDEIVVGVGAATGWYWVRHGDEERYGMAADEAINTIVQILMLYD